MILLRQKVFALNQAQLKRYVQRYGKLTPSQLKKVESARNSAAKEAKRVRKAGATGLKFTKSGSYIAKFNNPEVVTETMKASAPYIPEVKRIGRRKITEPLRKGDTPLSIAEAAKNWTPTEYRELKMGQIKSRLNRKVGGALAI